MKGVQVSFGVLVCAIIIVLIAFVFVGKKSKVVNNYNLSKHDSTTKENYGNLTNDGFVIYNHLLKDVRIKIKEPSGEITTLVRHIYPGRTQTILKGTAGQYFKQGNIMQVFIFDSSDKSDSLHIFGEYNLKYPKDFKLKEYHIGQITSKSVHGSGLNNVSNGNAIQGKPWVRIHNLSDFDISIQTGDVIPANDVFMFLGEDHYGVRLGTVFKDRTGLFEDYIYSTPATDIYYGIVSHNHQERYMGWQHSQGFEEIYSEPQFLLEEGFMGGPHNTQIHPEFVPVYGDSSSVKLDKWGNTV